MKGPMQSAILGGNDSWDDRRKTELYRVRSNGSRLAELEPHFRNEPDIVLAAIESAPEALKHAGKSLTQDRAWLLEAACRNWRVLEHIPEEFLLDEALVLMAVRQDLTALNRAAPELRQSLDFRAKAAAQHKLSTAPSTYHGEHVRLVGDFNLWHATDAHTRLTKLQAQLVQRAAPAPADAETMVQKPAKRTVVRRHRHQRVVHLVDGWLTFQVISCATDYACRIFPCVYGEVDQKQCQVVRDSPSGVHATIGGEDAGQDLCFCISEKPYTTIIIYVELMSGHVTANSKGAAGLPGRAAAVWYTVERKPGKYPGLLGVKFSEKQPKGRWWEPRLRPQAPEHDVRLSVPPKAFKVPLVDIDIPAGLDILVHAELQPKFNVYVDQVAQLSTKLFGSSEAESHPVHVQVARLKLRGHLVVVVDTTYVRALAYCLYVELTDCIWCYQVAVMEESRGQGLGSLLMRWAVGCAKQAGLSAVKLESLPKAKAFYERFGFQVIPDSDNLSDPNNFPMELPVSLDSQELNKVPVDVGLESWLKVRGVPAGVGSAATRAH